MNRAEFGLGYAAIAGASSIAVVTLFGFGWRDIPDGLDKTQVVEPVISQASFDRRSRRGDSRVAFTCFSSTHFDYVECKENVG